MSTFGWFYILGSVIVIVIALRFFYNTSNEDVKVKDLGFFLFIAFIAGLFSWTIVVVYVFMWVDKKCGNVVLIKRRKMKAEEFIAKHTYLDGNNQPAVSVSDAIKAAKLAEVGKQQEILEDAIHAKVCYYDGYHLLCDKDDVRRALPSGVKDGDVVSVIIVK